MLFYDRQHTIRANFLQTDCAHKQAANNAALGEKSIFRHLIDVGGIHHIGMRDKIIADGGQEAGNRGCVPSVAPDHCSYTGRHEQDSVEFSGIFDQAL